MELRRLGGQKAKGLRFVREKFNEPDFRAPAHREFYGALTRGRRRLGRRAAAYSLMGTQLLNGFFAVRREAAALSAAGRDDEAFVRIPGAKYAPIHPSLWTRNTPSPRGIVNGNLDRWTEGFQLNATGNPADRSQKSKDLVRRAYAESRPALHMAHALNHVLMDVGPKFEGWGEWDPLLVLLWNSNEWIDAAVEDARRWRASAGRGLSIKPEASELIDLIPRKCAE